MATGDPHRLLADDLPRRWGRYELQTVLGTGGWGRVFGAELLGAAGFRKPVALKVLLEQDAEGDAQLLDEARLGARLHHPHIVEVYDVGEVDGHVYIAMERVDGCNAHDLLDGRPLPARAVVELGLQLCDALEYAHGLAFEGRRQGLVHQDIKPSNILLDRSGRAKLADFGLARTAGLTRRAASDGYVEGTIGYIAPEQLGGEPVGQRADLFALAVTLVEVALGERAFDFDSREEYAFAVVDAASHLEERGALRAVGGHCPGLDAALAACLVREPGERLGSARELADRLRALRPEGAGLRDLVGETVPQRAELAPTLAPTLDVRRHNLGPEPDAMVGRTDEAAKILGSLREGERIVTLLGPGGVGKTRLARHVGRALAEQHDREVWFCELAEADDVAGVIRVVAATLGIRAEVPDDASALARAIALRGDVVLLLDNAEQAVEAVAAVAEALRSGTPRVQMVVTSREPLHVAGERRVRLAPLSPDDAAALFSLRTERRIDRSVLDRLLDGVDRLPLAVEMAAGMADVLPPETLLREVESHPERLRGRRRGLPRRHATLDGALRWSWNLLEPWEQSALIQLAVFRGGFTVEAADRVLDLSAFPDAPWTLFVIENLIDKSLLQTLPASDPIEPRFGPYLMVRAWAEELAAGRAEEWQGAIDRHIRWFALCGDTEFAYRIQGADARRAIAELHAEQGNLRIALARATAAGRPEQGPLAMGLILGLDVIGSTSESMQIARDALASAALAPHVRVRLRLTVGQALSIMAPAELPEWAEETLRQAQELGDPAFVAQALVSCGAAAAFDGDEATTREVWRRSRAIADAAGDPRLVARIVRFNGQTAFLMGQLEDARVLLEEARKLHRDAGLARTEAIVGSNLASTCWVVGDVARARTLYEEYIQAHRAMGDRRQELTVELNRVLIDGLEGLDADALRVSRERLLRIADGLRRQGDRPLVPVAAGIAALAGLRLGEDTQAELDDALAILREDHRIYTVPQLLNEVARYRLHAGDLDGADAALDEVLELSGGRVDRTSEAEMEAIRGRVALRRGDADEAQRRADRSAERFGSASIAPQSPARRDLHALAAELG